MAQWAGPVPYPGYFPQSDLGAGPLNNAAANARVLQQCCAPKTAVLVQIANKDQVIIMETTVRTRTSSLLGLFRAFTGDTKTLIRQEIQLAKKELSEKLSSFGKHVVSLAIGGFVAYAGLIVFLIGLGWLLAWVFQQAGLSSFMAAFIGLGAIGLLTIVIGAIFLMTGLNSLKSESLKPERTIQTLQELSGASPTPNPSTSEPEPAEQKSSAQIQQQVEQTEDRLGETLDELGRRFSPKHINAKVKQRISANPYRSGVIAMIAGLVSGLMLKHKFRHA